VGDLVEWVVWALAKPVLLTKQDLEQFCENGATFTTTVEHLEGKQTYGGYSTSVVVDENLYYAFQKI
jgi:D-arabinose 1-dehydrogenase-like Zn-dependent alcohol dehydrogenase